MLSAILSRAPDKNGLTAENSSSARAVSMPRPDDVPVTRTRLPFRSSPERTSSVVDVAPNFAVISDHLVDCPKWLGG